MYTSIYLFIDLSIYMFICLYVCLSIYLSLSGQSARIDNGISDIHCVTSKVSGACNGDNSVRDV